MGIVRPDWPGVNDGRLLGQVARPEKQAPAVSASRELAQAMQATEVVGGVPRAGGRVVEAQEGLILARKERVHVREHLVAELRALNVGAEAGKLVAAGAPLRDETLARHGWIALGMRETWAGVLINLVREAANLGNLV